MVIRDAQFAVFEGHARSAFEDKMTAHCREYAPRLSQVAGEDGVREAIRIGIERARKYGFNDEPQVRYYIDLMLVLGSDFDTDPQFPWAAETLRDSFSVAHVRGMILHRDLMLFLDRVMGGNKRHLKAALERVQQLPQELPRPEQRSGRNLRLWVRRLFPQKSADIDDAQLGRIAATAAEVANQFELPDGDGVLGTIMMIFGHGAARDPLYPWISGVLRDPNITSGEGRLQRLYARLRSYGEHAGKHLRSA